MPIKIVETLWKDKPIGDGSALEKHRGVTALRSSTLLLSASSLVLVGREAVSKTVRVGSIPTRDI